MNVSGRRVLARSALLMGSLVVALLLGEILLQVAATVVEVTGRHPDEAFTGDSLRVVCLGDSNTYGLHLDRSEAYPQQLEALWNSDARRPTIEVLNFGYPGTNSSTVRRELPRILRDLSPHVVVLLVGVNDSWTVPATDPAAPDLLNRLMAFLDSNSRLYRFYSILRNRGGGYDVIAPEVVSEPGIQRRIGTIEYGNHAYDLGFEGRREWAPSVDGALVSNLVALVHEAEAAGVAVILLTYPWDQELYAGANRLILQAGRSANASMIDLSEAFSQACDGAECEALFFPDGHPTARGHALVARILVQQLPSRLD